MLTLAIETTAKVPSCALMNDMDILSFFVCNNGNTHTENILPMIDDMLKKCKKSISDVELFCASNGPGSFTGVRIGASVIKGLAFGKNIPCVEVSALEALAYNLYPLNGIICPVMDARRGQLYNAVFRCENGNISRLTPDRAISAKDLSDELYAMNSENIYLVGDGYAVAKEAMYERKLPILEIPPTLIHESAVSVAIVGYKKYLRGEYTNDIDFSPSYLRMSQAERERIEKEKE